MTLAIPDRRLDELAEVINREHELAITAAGEALRHAIAVGEALIEVRKLLPYGEWERWAATHLNMSLQYANLYRRIACYRTAVLESGAVSLDHARAIVRGLPRYDGSTRYGDEVRREARAMLAAGHTHRQVARELGVAQATVADWALPSKRRRRRRQDAARRRAALKALREQEQQAAAKAKGGQIGEAYSLAYKLAEALSRAADEEGDDEARKALNSSLHALYKIRDKINAAIATSRPKDDE